MKAITENMIRFEIGENYPEVYFVKKGCILTTSAKDFLQQQKIKIAREGETPPPEKIDVNKSTDSTTNNGFSAVTPGTDIKANYVDYETGAYYDKKPEYMTQLYDNVLVRKDSDRIYFRGRLDNMQALIVFAQAIIFKIGEENVVNDLDTVLAVVRELMRADVLNDEVKEMKIIGMTAEEIHERSHNPQKYYNIEQCKLADYKLGRTYALLNLIRTGMREAEIAAARAYMKDRKVERPDIIQTLNRLSSAMHVMMSKYDAGEYNNK